jgi:uncharacterized membrane protein YecN with MAPEG domain
LTPFARTRLAELTSGVGALVLGIGLGALLASHLADLALPILASGIIVHAWGMYDKHRLERQADMVDPWWAAALYWVCWLILAAMLAWIVIRP